jgi:hypothetical protein
MRNLFDEEVDRYRLRNPLVLRDYGTYGDDTCGLFAFPSPLPWRRLSVIAASGLGWDHVSVSNPFSAPTWQEMDFVKRLFFRPEEVVMQLHVAEAEHINHHPNCLHLWRPHFEAVPLPPAEMV